MGRIQLRPTDAELSILRVLWARGPSTVRQVHEALSDTRDTGYTTTLKLMQIMADKGLVERNETARTHVYTAIAGQEQTQNQLVKDLVDRAFGGSAAALVLRALSADDATDAELKEIRKMIDDYREKR
jgi:BlaI family transcriptional regulator, penicillinase repressor